MARAVLCQGRSTVRESKAGVEPAFPERSIRHLHHQRWFEPRVRRGKPNEIDCCGAVEGAPLSCELTASSLCHRCPAHRLVPSGRPRALGHARFRASPGIRVSRSGLRRAVLVEPTLRTTKNPPEQWLGRVRDEQTVGPAFKQDPSQELGMRRRSAQSRSIL